MEGGDHADFGIGCASCYDEWEGGKIIDFLIGHLVKVRSWLDHSGCDVGSENTQVLGNDANFLGDGGCGAGMVTCEHMYSYAGRGAILDRLFCFQASWIIKTSQNEHGEVFSMDVQSMSECS